jgi:hypothetical protein
MKEAMASSREIRAYDAAIRDGDMDVVQAFIDKHGHVDTQALSGDDASILRNADHDILAYLDEEGYIELPPIAKAIIYDDPNMLRPEDITIEVMTLASMHGKKDVLRQGRLTRR